MWGNGRTHRRYAGGVVTVPHQDHRRWPRKPFHECKSRPHRLVPFCQIIFVKTMAPTIVYWVYNRPPSGCMPRGDSRFGHGPMLLYCIHYTVRMHGSERRLTPKSAAYMNKLKPSCPRNTSKTDTEEMIEYHNSRVRHVSDV